MKFQLGKTENKGNNDIYILHNIMLFSLLFESDCDRILSEEKIKKAL